MSGPCAAAFLNAFNDMNAKAKESSVPVGQMTSLVCAPSAKPQSVYITYPDGKLADWTPSEGNTALLTKLMSPTAPEFKARTMDERRAACLEEAGDNSAKRDVCEKRYRSSSKP